MAAFVYAALARMRRPNPGPAGCSCAVGVAARSSSAAVATAARSYCGGECARQGRRQAQRAAAKRYAASANGKHSHADRAHRYRARQGIVTYQGSPMPPVGGVVTVGAMAISRDMVHERGYHGSPDSSVARATEPGRLLRALITTPTNGCA